MTRDQVVRGGGAVMLHEHGRRLMRDAFVELSDAARQMGLHEEFISTLHGQFFDGNVEVKKAMREMLDMLNKDGGTSENVTIPTNWKDGA